MDRTSFAKADAAGGKLGGREEVKVSADVNTSSFAKARAAQALLTKESTKLSDVFNRSNLSIGQQTGALAGLLPVLVDVTGAAGALASSASAAALGVSALAVGGVGAASVGLAGLASVAVPAVASLKDLKTAQDAYTLAVQQYGKHSTEARTAFQKLQVEQKKAGPEAAKFAGNLAAIGRRFKDLTSAGRRDLFGGLNDALDKLNKKLPMLAKSANSSVKTLRGGFDIFFKRATGPEFDKFIKAMTRTFANAIPPVARAFGNIAKILERIAVAVGPDVVRILKQFNELTIGWLHSTQNAGQLRDTIHQMVNQTETWLKLIGAAGKLLIAVLVPGAGQGQKAIKGITDQLKEWTKWVDAHPKEMRDFFKEALKTTGLLAEVLVGFIPQLFQISIAMRPIARAFLSITKALNSLKIGNVSALTVLLGAFVAGRIIKSVVGLVSALSRVKEAYIGIRAAALGAAGAESTAGAAGIAQAPFGAPLATTGAEAEATGASWGTRFAAGARAAIIPVFSGLSVAIAGSIVAQPILNKFHDIAQSAANNFPEPFKGIGGSIADLGIPTSLLPQVGAGGLQGPLAKLFGFQGALGHPAQAALDNLNKSLKPLIDTYGNLFKVGKKASAEQLHGLLSLATNAQSAGAITQGQLSGIIEKLFGLGKQVKQTGDRVGKFYDHLRTGAKDVGDKVGKTFLKLGDAAYTVGNRIGDAFQKANKTASQAANNMRQNVVGDVGSMGTAVAAGMVKLNQNLNNALKALGVSKVDFKIGVASVGAAAGAGAHGHQTGGMVVPGTGPGDKVHMQAMVEPGERVFVLNRNASSALANLEDMNRRIPRFQQGGIVDRTGVPHLAGGGFAGMHPEIVALAKYFISHFGGSMSSGFRPGDPGFHGRGEAADIVPSNWGGATAYANKIGSQLLEGIHQGPPGSNVSWDSGHQVPPSFWGGATWAAHVSHIHLATANAISGAAAAVAKKLDKVTLRGPMGPLLDMGQASLDKVRGAADRYIAAHQPKGALMGPATGVAKVSDLPRSLQKYNRQYPKDPIPYNTPTMPLNKIAELAEWAGKGGVPGKTMAQVTIGESGSHPGAYGTDPGGTHGIGLWQITTGFNDALISRLGGTGAMLNPILNAIAMADIYKSQGLGAWYGTGAVTSSNAHYSGPLKQLGGLLPYLGKFHEGGVVPFDGMGFLKGGELVLPKLRTGGETGPGGGGDRRTSERFLGILGLGDASLKHRLRELKMLSKDPFLDERWQNGIKQLIVETKELKHEQKALRTELKDHHRLGSATRANEASALRAVTNLVGSQIGFSANNKRRLAAGSTRSY